MKIFKKLKIEREDRYVPESHKLTILNSYIKLSYKN